MLKSYRLLTVVGNGLLMASLLGVSSGAVVHAQAPARSVPTVQAPAPADGPLTEQELALAAKVHVGAKSCELGRSVQIDPIADAPGHFNLRLEAQNYRMRPVETSTGALRLEDRALGAVWIQLADKSMLMSQRQGRRLADGCANSLQRAVAAAMKLNPGQSLLGVASAPNPN